MTDTEPETAQYDVIEEVKALNRDFQENAEYGAVSLNGIAGYHSLFSHEDGLDYAWGTALHAAIDEVLMEVSLDPRIVRENQDGEVTPRAVRQELRQQLQAFTTVNDRFAERLCEEFEDKLRGYESDLESQA